MVRRPIDKNSRGSISRIGRLRSAYYICLTKLAGSLD
jgi:hypothetical protein